MRRLRQILPSYGHLIKTSVLIVLNGAAVVALDLLVTGTFTAMVIYAAVTGSRGK